MIKRLLLLGAIVGLADPILLYFIYREWGGWTAVGVAFLPAMIGAHLQRLARSRITMTQDATAFPQMLADQMLIGAATPLFLYPGPLSSLLGFSLLIPAVRRLLQSWAVDRIKQSTANGNMTVMTSMEGAVGGWPVRDGRDIVPPGNLKRAEGIVIEPPNELPGPL